MFTTSCTKLLNKNSKMSTNAIGQRSCNSWGRFDQGVSDIPAKKMNQIRQMIQAHGASKSLEAEYIRSLHKQIYLLELENKYIREEFNKSKIVETPEVNFDFDIILLLRIYK